MISARGLASSSASLSALLGVALPLAAQVAACNLMKKSAADAGSDAEASAATAATEASVEPAPSASATATHAAAHPAGPPSPGVACTPHEGVSGHACAPGGFEELECVAGVWKVIQTCRGAGGCKSDGAGIHCDPGNPLAGDACTPGAPSRCMDAHSELTCKQGKWVSSLCVPPAKCVSDTKSGAAGCK